MDTGWVTKAVQETVFWKWDITAASDVSPQRATVQFKGPDGSFFEERVEMEIAIISPETPLPTPTPGTDGGGSALPAGSLAVVILALIAIFAAAIYYDVRRRKGQL